MNVFKRAARGRVGSPFSSLRFGDLVRHDPSPFLFVLFGRRSEEGFQKIRARLYFEHGKYVAFRSDPERLCVGVRIWRAKTQQELGRRAKSGEVLPCRTASLFSRLSAIWAKLVRLNGLQPHTLVRTSACLASSSSAEAADGAPPSSTRTMRIGSSCVGACMLTRR